MTRLPAIARPVDPNRIWISRAGYYATRLTKGGSEVGCVVAHGPALDPETGEPLDRSWLWTITINGFNAYCSPMEPPEGMFIGRPITEAEYRYLIDDRAWAKAHAPHLPEANPRQAFALEDRPIPFLEA